MGNLSNRCLLYTSTYAVVVEFACQLSGDAVFKSGQLVFKVCQFQGVFNVFLIFFGEAVCPDVFRDGRREYPIILKYNSEFFAVCVGV